MYKLYMHFYNVAVLYVCRRSSQLMTPQWLGGHTIQRDAVIGCNFFAHASSSAWSAARGVQDLYNSFILVLLQLCGPEIGLKFPRTITVSSWLML